MNGKKKMNEAVITLKITDSELNLMIETLRNTTLNGTMKEPLARLQGDFEGIMENVAAKRRMKKLVESREVTIG
jgi:hypothetical protein|tara:strand:+ start:30 stop:251 length:222 start_codon:yes stop_codon:yes gene_type:complete